MLKKKIRKNPFLEIFSLTGALQKCSAYQHPGRRRGEVFTTVPIANSTLPGLKFVLIIWKCLLFIVLLIVKHRKDIVILNIGAVFL
jgi:hypothetical protein